MIIVNAVACWHTGTRLKPSALVSSDICSGEFRANHRTVMTVPECLSGYGKASGWLHSINRTMSEVVANPGQTNIACEQWWWFQFWWRCADIRGRWRWLRDNVRHLYGCSKRYPATTKRLWTMQTKIQRPIRLISSTLSLDAERNLFPILIRRRSFFM